jgi:hypothetical protein
MGFAIEVKTGEQGTVTLRGCSDGTVEMCKWGDKKDAGTGVATPTLIAFRFYASIEQAFDRVARMRVTSYDADTLKELVEGIRAIRSDIKREMGSLI